MLIIKHRSLRFRTGRPKKGVNGDFYHNETIKALLCVAQWRFASSPSCGRSGLSRRLSHSSQLLKSFSIHHLKAFSCQGKSSHQPQRRRRRTHRSQFQFHVQSFFFVCIKRADSARMTTKFRWKFFHSSHRQIFKLKLFEFARARHLPAKFVIDLHVARKSYFMNNV